MDSLNGLVVSCVIYKSPDQRTQVMKGTWGDCPVVVKVLPYSETSWKEANIQNSLSYLDSVCKIYSVVSKEETAELYVVMELLEGDLNMEIERRAASGEYWSEEELWGMFRTLIFTFTAAQSYGIAHRDIKPQNIFYSYPNRLKVGDFGCAKDTLSESAESIIGSPYYFSPELKRAYRTSLFGLSSKSNIYNAFKSDVYSLGVTFLTMILLGPSVVLMDIDHLEANTMQELTKVPYESMKTLLVWMLQPVEQHRGDFMQINGYVESLFQPPAVSGETIVSNLNSLQEDWVLYGLQQLMQSSVRVLPSISIYKICYCGGTLYVNLCGAYTRESLYYCSLECYYKYDPNAWMFHPNIQSQTVRPEQTKQKGRQVGKVVLTAPKDYRRSLPPSLG